MRLAESKQKFVPWLAAGFCAILSLITIVSNLGLSLANRSDVGGWAIGFLCFLPMCFYFAGVALSQMQQEIRALKRQVDELQCQSRRPTA